MPSTSGRALACSAGVPAAHPSRRWIEPRLRRLLTQGHCQLEQPRAALRGAAESAAGGAGACGALACHPSMPLLASASADLTLRLWDVVQRQMEGMRMLPALALDLAFAPTSVRTACSPSREDRWRKPALVACCLLAGSLLTK
jgi:hypothetical protein